MRYQICEEIRVQFATIYIEIVEELGEKGNSTHH